MTDLFFSDDREDQAEAKAICSGCAFIVRCGLAAVRRNERHGTWAGWTPAERASLVREVKRRAG